MLEPKTLYPNPKALSFDELLDEYMRTHKRIADTEKENMVLGIKTDHDSLDNYHAFSLWGEVDRRLATKRVSMRLVLFIFRDTKDLL